MSRVVDGGVQGGTSAFRDMSPPCDVGWGNVVHLLTRLSSSSSMEEGVDVMLGIVSEICVPKVVVFCPAGGTFPVSLVARGGELSPEDERALKRNMEQLRAGGEWRVDGAGFVVNIATDVGVVAVFSEGVPRELLETHARSVSSLSGMVAMMLRHASSVEESSDASPVVDVKSRANAVTPSAARITAGHYNISTLTPDGFARSSPSDTPKGVSPHDAHAGAEFPAVNAPPRGTTTHHPTSTTSSPTLTENGQSIPPERDLPMSAFEESPTAMLLLGVPHHPIPEHLPPGGGGSREVAQPPTPPVSPHLDTMVLAMNSAFRKFVGATTPVGVSQHGTDPGAGTSLHRDIMQFPPFTHFSSSGDTHEVQFSHASGNKRWGAVTLTQLTEPVADAYGVCEVYRQASHHNQVVWLVHIYDVTDRHRIEEQLHHSSFHETVTGLPNRSALLRHMTTSLSHMNPSLRWLGLIVLDLDDFRSINETLGSSGGDTYLQTIAAMLTEVCEKNDFLAHLGSDEFAIATTRISDETSLAEFAERVRFHLAEGITVNGRNFSSTASLGVAWGRRLTDPEVLLSQAAGAVKIAKNRGGNSWAFAGRYWKRDASRNVAIEADLRHAIKTSAFDLRYQPIFSLTPGGTLTEVEALLRWQHPLLGQIPPPEFIEVAERRNLMPELGMWVLRNACEQSATWDTTLTTPAPTIAVNVSSKQLETGNFAESVTHLLDEFGLPPERIMMELTESQVLNTTGDSGHQITTLANVGIRIAVDDFGTGHSNFDYLRKLPITTLKIDKTFIDGIVDNTTDRAILRSVVNLGANLNLTVTAEGIETPQQLEILREYGCTQGQGWLWCPAMKPAEITHLIGIPEHELQQPPSQEQGPTP